MNSPQIIALVGCGYMLLELINGWKAWQYLYGHDPTHDVLAITHGMWAFLWSLFLIGHLYLSGVWVKCGSMNTHPKKDKCLEAIGLHAQNLLTILGSTLNVIGGGGGGIWSFDEFQKLHFDNEQNIHISSQNCEANGCRHNLELVIILHWLRVSHPRRRGCRAKSVQSRYTYLIGFVLLHFWSSSLTSSFVRIR